MKSIPCALKYGSTMNINITNREWTGCPPREAEMKCDVIQSATFQGTVFSLNTVRAAVAVGGARDGTSDSEQQLEHNPGWLTQFQLWVHKTCPDHKILTPQTHEIRGPCLGYWWPNQGNWGHAIVFCLWTIHRGKFSTVNSLFLHILYKLWTLSPNQCHMWSLIPVNYLSRDEIKITVSAFGEILSWWILVSGSRERELFSSMPRAFEWRSSEEFCLTTSLHASHTLLSQIHSPVIEDFFVSAAMLGWESHITSFLLLSLLYSFLILFPFLFLFPSFFFLCLFPLDFGWGPLCVITAGFMIFPAPQCGADT